MDKIKANIRWMQLGFGMLKDWLINFNKVIVSPKIDYRLPIDLLPFYYDLYFEFQFDTLVSNSFPYNGQVFLYFACVKNTSSLVLNINKLDVQNSSLKLSSTTDQNFNPLTAFNWYNDFTRQFFIANLTEQQFTEGQNYTLFIQFVGYLTDDNAGFYRSSYFDDNGNLKWLMTSQMESTDARKSFPCFDEPAMKAQFKISAIHRSDYNALSNMPRENLLSLLVYI